MSGGIGDELDEPETKPHGEGRRRRAVVVAVAAATAVAVAVAIPLGLVRLDGESPQEPADLPPVKLAAGLTAFDACPAFLSYVQGSALEDVGPYGFRSGDVAVAARFGSDTGTMGRVAPLPPGAPAPMPAADAAEAGASAVGQETYSGTSVQVADVDEPDSAKTDGRRWCPWTATHYGCWTWPHRGCAGS